MGKNTTISIDSEVLEALGAIAYPGESRNNTMRRLLKLPTIVVGCGIYKTVAAMEPGDSHLFPVGRPNEIDGDAVAKINRAVRRARKAASVNLVVERHLTTSPDQPGLLCLKVACLL